jgi:UDP-2,3-diacylglucosamine pyrophosphatase LpxH
VRTLVVSDLHLGSRLRRDVLRRPAALEALLSALARVDRLVLLGDVVELSEGRPDEAMAAAAPVLRAIGTGLGPDREVILVPGNHDHALVGPWVDRSGALLSVDAVVPLDATPELARVASWLSPARVRAHYPGVWLSRTIWATHGHYLDRHLLPEGAFGVARGLLGRLPRDGASPFDYEHAGGPSMTWVEATMTSRLPRPLARLFDDAVELLRAATMPGIQRGVFGRRTARFVSSALGAQMRRASMPALARVVHRLQVDADLVVFGHVHRCGPFDSDDRSQWRGPGGRPQMINSGSWVYEPLLVHRAKPPHPYWPGGVIMIESETGARALGLLDHLDAGALH